MSRCHSVSMYFNAHGQEPMKFGREVYSDDDPLSEVDLAKTLEAVVEGLNDLPRAAGIQIVFVEDGLIIAVESLTRGKLVWCN
jgi:hypothetical protein